MTIRVSKIAKADGSKEIITDYLIDGSAKALAHWDENTAVKSSLNISSLNDLGTGDTTANYTNTFSSEDYYWSSGIGYVAVLNEASQSLKVRGGRADIKPGFMTLRATQVSEQTSKVIDPEVTTIIVHGDLT